MPPPLPSESWTSRDLVVDPAPDCARRNRIGIPCFRGQLHGGIHCGYEAGGGTVSWTDDEPEGLSADEAARWLLSHSEALSELCRQDPVAARGACVVLALLTQEELGTTVATLQRRSAP